MRAVRNGQPRLMHDRLALEPRPLHIPEHSSCPAQFQRRRWAFEPRPSGMCWRVCMRAREILQCMQPSCTTRGPCSAAARPHPATPAGVPVRPFAVHQDDPAGLGQVGACAQQPRQVQHLHLVTGLTTRCIARLPAAICPVTAGHPPYSPAAGVRRPSSPALPFPRLSPSSSAGSSHNWRPGTTPWDP